MDRAKPPEPVDAPRLEAARQLVRFYGIDNGNEFEGCLMDIMSRGYARQMTESDMQSLIMFESSPVGQKYTAATLHVKDEFGEIFMKTFGTWISFGK